MICIRTGRILFSVDFPQADTYHGLCNKREICPCVQETFCECSDILTNYFNFLSYPLRPMVPIISLSGPISKSDFVLNPERMECDYS